MVAVEAEALCRPRAKGTATKGENRDDSRHCRQPARRQRKEIQNQRLPASRKGSAPRRIFNAGFEPFEARA
jgi:hypothetical protein